MPVIVIAQTKGGVGKTTLAINVADCIARKGHTVTLIDTDPRQDSFIWSKPGKLPFIVRAAQISTKNQIIWLRDVLKDPSSIKVIDLPSNLGVSFQTAALIADLILVPCGPSQADIRGTKSTLGGLVDLRKKHVENCSTAITFVTPTRIFGTEQHDRIISNLAHPFASVSPMISFDDDLVNSAWEGLTISQSHPLGRASEEISVLSSFIMQQILPRKVGRLSLRMQKFAPTGYSATYR